MLQVYSIFSSLQGESTRAGLPCTFVRLAGCPLRCTYCDTEIARDSKGVEMTEGQILDEVRHLSPRLVEVTGGEPLAQVATTSLLSSLLDADFEVLLETSGAFGIEGLDPRLRIILDLKCPGSGMSGRMRWDNLAHLATKRCEIKFVVLDRRDFEWAVQVSKKYALFERVEVLVSPVSGSVALRDLAAWILDSNMPFRLQLQLHKLIWPGDDEEK